MPLRTQRQRSAGDGHERGDVVGHVPGVVGPDGGAAGLELDDPVGELHEFEVAPLVLQGAGAHPEDVGEDAAEAAEGDGGEGDERRHVLRRRRLRQMRRRPHVQQVDVEGAGEGERGGDGN